MFNPRFEKIVKHPLPISLYTDAFQHLFFLLSLFLFLLFSFYGPRTDWINFIFLFVVFAAGVIAMFREDILKYTIYSDRIRICSSIRAKQNSSLVFNNDTYICVQKMAPRSFGKAYRYGIFIYFSKKGECEEKLKVLELLTSEQCLKLIDALCKKNKH